MTELELRAHRALAIHEIENLMARHTIYHARIWNYEELDTLWTKKQADEAVWSQNFGRWIGMHKIFPYYGPIESQMERGETLKAQLLEVHPEYTEKLKNLDVRGLSEMSTHVLCSSIIEVADDGMSAKGVWYTPGFGLTANDAGRDVMDVRWMWEKYGADFVYEDGEWKFLHLLICMDIMAGGDVSDWSAPKKAMGGAPGGPGGPGGAPGGPGGAPGGAPGGPGGPGGAPGGAPGGPAPDSKKGASPAQGGAISVKADEPGRYKDYSHTRLITESPRFPEPYESLDKTWSY